MKNTNGNRQLNKYLSRIFSARILTGTCICYSGSSAGSSDLDGRDPMTGHPEETSDELLAEQTDSAVETSGVNVGQPTSVTTLISSIREDVRLSGGTLSANADRMMSSGREENDPVEVGSPVKVVIDSYDEMSEKIHRLNVR